MSRGYKISYCAYTFPRYDPVGLKTSSSSTAKHKLPPSGMEKGGTYSGPENGTDLKYMYVSNL